MSKTPKAPRYVKIGGWVVCGRHAEVHEDKLDPYDYGEPQPGYDDDRCTPDDHAPVYQRID